MLFNGHLASRILIDYSLPPGSSTRPSPPHPRQVSLLNDCRRQSASRLFITGTSHFYDGTKSCFHYFFVIVPRAPCRLLYSATSDGEHIISTNSKLAGFRRKRNLSRAVHGCV